MAHYIKGDKVANATSYELFEKKVDNMTEQTFSWITGAIKGDGTENTLNTFIKTDFINFDEKTTMKFVVPSVNYLVYVSVYSGGKVFSERTIINKNPDTSEVFNEVDYSFDPGKYYKLLIGTVAATEALKPASAKDYVQIYTYEGSENLVSLKTAAEINFNLSEIDLEAGDHILMVQAHADGYESSDLSNQVVYSVSES